MTQQTLNQNAKQFAMRCKRGLSPGQAMLTLQSEIAKAAKQRAKGKDWLALYVTMRAETNKTFWDCYRGL